jgi:hypothetical protein
MDRLSEPFTCGACGATTVLEADYRSEFGSRYAANAYVLNVAPSCSCGARLSPDAGFTHTPTSDIPLTQDLTNLFVANGDSVIIG